MVSNRNGGSKGAKVSVSFSDGGLAWVHLGRVVKTQYIVHLVETACKRNPKNMSLFAGDVVVSVPT